MTAVSAEQCVATDGLIQPDKIPGATASDNEGGQLNAAAINDACQQARNVASKVRTGVSSVETAWSVLPTVFVMPGAEPVHGAMSSPGTSLNSFAGKLDSMARALEDFADAIEPLRLSFDEVRVRAQEFVDSLEPGNKVWMRASSTTEYQWDANASPHSSYTSSVYGTSSYSSSYSYGGSSGSSTESTAHTAWDAAAYLRGRGETARVSGGTVEILVTWLESGEHVGRNNDLMDEVADLYARLHAAEVDCANRINGLREDVCVAPLEAVEAWQLKQDGVELPWGSRVEEKRNCGEQVGNGFVEFGKGTVHGLGSLISYNYMSGEWGDWDHAEQSWAGIGDIVVSLSTLSGGALGLINVAVNGPSAYTDSLETVTELGKSLVAWDTWEDAPAQAATETILNIGTAFIPVGGWALAGAKGLSAAAGATRIASALNKLDNLVPNALARLGGGNFKIDIDGKFNVDAPNVRVDADGPSIKPDSGSPSVNADGPSNPGGLADDAVRAGDDSGPSTGAGKPDDGPGNTGNPGGLADDAVRAGDDSGPSTGADKADDSPDSSGSGAADEPDARPGPEGPDTGVPDDSAPGSGPLLDSQGNDIAPLVERSGLTREQLEQYLRNEGGHAHAEYVETGRWPADVQVPKNAEVLRADGSIDWDQVPQGGYTLDETGNAVKETIVPQAGDTIDRYGPPGGRYTSPVPESGPYSYEQRSLPYVEDPNQYHRYEFTADMDRLREFYDNAPASVRGDVDDLMRNYRMSWDDLTVSSGSIAPGFGDPGGGIQWQLPLPVSMLEDLGILRKV